MTTNQDTCVWKLELEASVDAVDGKHALILVALDVLRSAYDTEDGTVAGFGPDVPAGYIGYVNFQLGPDD